jgi:hypothetical protein
MDTPAPHPSAHLDDLPEDGDSITSGAERDEIRQHDRETLTGEEEAERLLDSAEASSGSVRRPRHRNQRRLEEGNQTWSSATSSATSSQEDIRRVKRSGERKEVCRYHRQSQEMVADVQKGRDCILWESFRSYIPCHLRCVSGVAVWCVLCHLEDEDFYSVECFKRDEIEWDA